MSKSIVKSACAWLETLGVTEVEILHKSQVFVVIKALGTDTTKLINRVTKKLGAPRGIVRDPTRRDRVVHASWPMPEGKLCMVVTKGGTEFQWCRMTMPIVKTPSAKLLDAVTHGRRIRTKTANGTELLFDAKEAVGVYLRMVPVMIGKKCAAVVSVPKRNHKGPLVIRAYQMPDLVAREMWVGERTLKNSLSYVLSAF